MTHRPRLATWAALALVAGLDSAPAARAQEPAEPAGVARIRRDAELVRPLVATDLAREFLGAVPSLPAIAPRTLYFDPGPRRYLTEADAGALAAEAREALKPIPVDESFYYNTRYGSPLAYARPLDVLGRAGLAGLPNKRLLDFGCGGLGPLRLMASLGADAVGVDVDPMLPALYSEPGDQGAVPGGGKLTLVDGRFPADAAVRERVGAGYDLILSKNTLKRGYVHPERPADKRQLLDLGADDAGFLGALATALKPGGLVLIYNLGPAPAAPDAPYKPMADIRNPFPRAAWEAAGFELIDDDRDDTPATRSLARALGWDRGPGGMNLETDLFAAYTLARKAR